MPEFYDVVHARSATEPRPRCCAADRRSRAGVKEQLPGLLDIRLVRLEDGTYLDILRWESREAADAAIERFAEVPEAGEIHDFLGGGDLAHHRGEVVGG